MQTNKEVLKRCAVVKVDFGGRIVYVDEYAEQLLGIPGEDLFGHSIKEFLDKESFNTLALALQNRKHYETYYQAADLVFTASRQNRFARGAVISLNIIAGTPANYQIIVTPFSDSEAVSSDATVDDEMISILYDFVSKLDRSVDWESLCRELTKVNDVTQVGIYKCDGGNLDLIASGSTRTDVKEKVDLIVHEEKHTAVAVNRKPRADKITTMNGSAVTADDAGFVDASYPLAQGDHCWGVLRVIHNGDHAKMDECFSTAANFLGNVLFSYAASSQMAEPAAV